MFIIIVTHDYPPTAGPGAMRAYWLASGLTRFGHRVLVVTAQPEPTLDAAEVVAVPYTSTGSKAKRLAGVSADTNAAVVAAAKGRTAEALVRWLAKTLERTLLHPDKYRAWIRTCDAWLASNRGLVASADAVIATSPPPSAAYVGRRLAQASGASRCGSLLRLS